MAFPFVNIVKYNYALFPAHGFIRYNFPLCTILAKQLQRKAKFEISVPEITFHVFLSLIIPSISQQNTNFVFPFFQKSGYIILPKKKFYA